MRNENILCVSYCSWEGPYTKSTVQLMSRLAKDNKVLFAEYPYTIKDVVTLVIRKDYNKAMQILGLKCRLSTKKTSVNSTVFHWILPPMLPTDFIKSTLLYSLVMQLNSWIYKRSIKKAFRRLGIQEFININAYNPSYGYFLTGKLREKANIYYCYDGINPKRFPQIAEYDKQFTRKANCVIVSSDYLKEQKGLYNKNVFAVKNGVDFDGFNSVAKITPNTFPSKKIGYIGSLDHRFDIEKVEYAVQNLSNCEFEFIGDLRNETIKTQLQQYKNVSFNPPIPPQEVPMLLKKYDAGIIPYIANDMNKNIYPLKINEFLAIGVPVILTAFAHLPEFESNVSFAKTKEEFLAAIQNELKIDNSERIKQRIEFASRNSWENRTKQFEAIIMKTLATLS